MSSQQSVGKTVSVEQFSEYDGDQAVAKTDVDEEELTAAWQFECPECAEQVITQGHESYCGECGLVVTSDRIDRQPTRTVHGPGRGSGPKEWAVESVNPFRTDKALHTTFFLSTDGYGNTLSSKAKTKYGRLRQRHNRFRMRNDREIRLNEGLRDVQQIGENLALPRFVAEDAALLLKWASAARLPCGHISWEALAGGAVLLAAHAAEFPRDISEVAEYTKVTHERLCAGARKIRCGLGLTEDFPPIRPRAVDTVLAVLDDEVSEADAGGRIAWIAYHLLDLADEIPVGPGTPRLGMAAAAVYAADRLTDGKQLTQPQVVEAVSVIVDTSVSKLGRYSRELHDAYVERYGTDDSAAVLARGRLRLR